MSEIKVGDKVRAKVAFHVPGTNTTLDGKQLGLVAEVRGSTFMVVFEGKGNLELVRGEFEPVVTQLKASKLRLGDKVYIETQSKWGKVVELKLQDDGEIWIEAAHGIFQSSIVRKKGDTVKVER